MNADEWLARFGKHPWHLSGWWYWSVDRWYGSDECVPVDADEADFILPAPVFDRMRAKTTYPMCKMYGSEEDALADFRVGFAAAVGAGWNPEDVESPVRGQEGKRL